MTKLTIEHAREVARQRGGECLSETYVNCKTPLHWKCNLEHEWWTKLDSIKNGNTWCPECSGKKRLTIEEARKIATERDGQCLSDKYINNRIPLHWKCKFGHQWFTTIDKIKNGSTWCPECAGNKRLTIEEAQREAIKRGGQCLSVTYVNCGMPLRWKCGFEHEWIATFADIKNSHSWCPECAGNRCFTIEDARREAIKRNGECLSDVYVNSKTSLRWRCHLQHEWLATFSDIKNQGTWCPICRISHGERAIHDWLTQNKIEFISQFGFPKMRRRYDFYIPSSNWLIEFDGVQHFKEVEFFASESLKERQQADREKTQTAISNGLCLLRIHYEDRNKIPELLNIVTIKMAPQIVCSRVPEYSYLNITVTLPPKRLSLNVVTTPLLHIEQ